MEHTRLLSLQVKCCLLILDNEDDGALCDLTQVLFDTIKCGPHHGFLLSVSRTLTLWWSCLKSCRPVLQSGERRPGEAAHARGKHQTCLQRGRCCAVPEEDRPCVCVILKLRLLQLLACLIEESEDVSHRMLDLLLGCAISTDNECQPAHRLQTSRLSQIEAGTRKTLLICNLCAHADSRMPSLDEQRSR